MIIFKNRLFNQNMFKEASLTFINHLPLSLLYIIYLLYIKGLYMNYNILNYI